MVCSLVCAGAYDFVLCVLAGRENCSYVFKKDLQRAKSLHVWVLSIGIFSGILLVGLYPITARDVALYMVRARLWAFYGGSSMTALPADFPHDPYIRLSGEYNMEVSPYGPMWELITQVPICLGLFDIATGIIAMKVIALFRTSGWQFSSAGMPTRIHLSTACHVRSRRLTPSYALRVIAREIYPAEQVRQVIT